MASANIIIIGAMGRMGQMIQKACAAQDVDVIGLVEAPQSPMVGESAFWKDKELEITSDLTSVITKDSVLIDFTIPQSTLGNIETAKKAGAKIVIGTTGFSEEEKSSIQESSKEIGIVLSPNMSVGVNVLFKVTEIVSRTLGIEYDIEITEAHHKHKVDSPSGTAVGLAEAVGRGREINYHDHAIYGREGIVGERKPGEIGMHALRGGSVVGDHTVHYAGDGERIQLTHLAQDRIIFANGAVKAAQFLAAKENGLFSMFDVLGLNKI